MRTEDSGSYIFVASIRLRNGKRIYASAYGLKAFRIRVKEPKKPNSH